MDAGTIPCTSCGASLPILLGRPFISCNHCHSKQTIAPNVEARLRSHYHRVEALLELAHIERGRAAQRRTSRAVWSMIAMLLASLYCLYNRWVIPALSGFGLYFVGMIGFGLLEHRTRRRMPPPEAGQVRCGHCGVSVPILATEESTECPSCGSPLALSPSALAQAVTAAEQALARAERAGGGG